MIERASGRKFTLRSDRRARQVRRVIRTVHRGRAVTYRKIGKALLRLGQCSRQLLELEFALDKLLLRLCMQLLFVTNESVALTLSALERCESKQSTRKKTFVSADSMHIVYRKKVNEFIK